MASHLLSSPVCISAHCAAICCQQDRSGSALLLCHVYSGVMRSWAMTLLHAPHSAGKRDACQHRQSTHRPDSQPLKRKITCYSTLHVCRLQGAEKPEWLVIACLCHLMEGLASMAQPAGPYDLASRQMTSRIKASSLACAEHHACAGGLQSGTCCTCLHAHAVWAS